MTEAGARGLILMVVESKDMEFGESLPIAPSLPGKDNSLASYDYKFKTVSIRGYRPWHWELSKGI